MHRVLIAFALAAAMAPAHAAENQAFLGIFAETKSMRMAGMAMPELPPGVDLSKIPGAGQMMAMFAPQRVLTVRLWSPGIAPEGATASLVPPAGLKLGERLNLDLYRPGAQEAAGPGDYDPEKIPDFTMKRYWGSSATVKAGQPEVFTLAQLTPEQKQAMREAARQAQRQTSYFYKPDWTTAYWPARNQPGALTPDASLAGTYRLTSTYTGAVALDVPADVQILAPIEITAPNLEQRPDLKRALTLRWKPVPSILGYHAQVFGMQGKNTAIQWSSSEIRSDPAANWDYMQMAEVRERVQSTAMMSPDRAEVIVPAGIFKDCDTVMLMMVGYGPGTALDNAQPLPRLQTKTTLTVVLGGKQ